MDALLRHAALWQAAVLLAAFVAVLWWERGARRTAAADPARPRANLGLLLVNQGLPLLLVPLTATLGTWLAGRSGLAADTLPLWVGIPLSLIVLDGTGWLVHRALHAHPWLWRVHEVHHSDRHFDSLLAFRFHPLDAALHVLAQTAVASVLGLPAIGVLVTGLVIAAHNVFVHAGAVLPPPLERLLGWLIVTPARHRVHHSTDEGDARHNFGIVWSFWDRLAGTARAPGEAVSRDTGVARLGDGSLGLLRLLWLPLERHRAQG